MKTIRIIAVSLLAIMSALSLHLASAQQLRAKQTRGTMVPASGKLLGQNALDDGEWAPRDGKNRIVVLFGLAVPGQVGDLEFWREVASRSVAEEPTLQFVGLCADAATCKVPPGAEGVLTLLKSMDPAQTHAVMTAARQGKAFAFRGQQLDETLSMRVLKDRRDFATKIAGLSSGKTKVGGS